MFLMLMLELELVLRYNIGVSNFIFFRFRYNIFKHLFYFHFVSRVVLYAALQCCLFCIIFFLLVLPTLFQFCFRLYPVFREIEKRTNT